MILITLILAVALIFLSGIHWCAYLVDKQDGKRYLNSLTWSIVCGLMGVYFNISLIGLAAR